MKLNFKTSIKGGGLSIGFGFGTTGTTDLLKIYLKKALTFLTFDKKELVLLIVLLISTLTTEFTANSFISSIFIPVVDSIASHF